MILVDCDVASTFAKIDRIVSGVSLERSIHFGEAEGLAIAKNRGAIFLSNDAKVIRFCKKSGISVLDLKDLLVLIAAKKIVSMTDLQKILKDIEAKDRICIKSEDRALILDQFK
jgi:predicted nucleic acid-binding protein